MSKIKKILAVVLAMAMVLMMSMSVFADDITPTPAPSDPVEPSVPAWVFTDTTTVKINNIPDGTSVTLYKVAGYTKDANTGAISYGLETWVPSTVTLGALGVTDGVSGIHTQATSATLADLVTRAPKSGSTGISMSVSETGVATASVPVGIYVAVPAGGAAVFNPMMVSVNFTNDANGKINGIVGSEIDAKCTEGPDFTKEAKEAPASVKAGELVNYTINTTIPKYDSSYTSATFTVSDTLTHLDLNTASIVVKVNSNPVTAADNTFALTTATNGFTVAFASSYILGLEAAAPVEITYTATVNNDLNTNATARNNKATLTYSTNPNGGTSGKEAQTNHYTFDIDGILKKVDGNTPLPRAEFTIYTDEACTVPYTNGHITGPATSGADGDIEFLGLAAGTYYVKETKAPNGYSLNTDVFEVEISAVVTGETLTSYSIKVDGNEVGGTAIATVSPVSIPNTKLASLPSTGGIGTTIFTVVGCVLMIAAAAMFFVSRRKAED